MSLEPDVLERNLQLLFTRAYAPVRAAPAFRARLQRELESAIAGTRRAARPARSAFAVRLAAAILVAVGAAVLGWRLLGGSGRATASVEHLLAGGHAAVREGSSGAWRAFTEEEARSGVRFADAALELATPAGVSAHVLVGSDGALDAQPTSRVALDAPREGGLVVALQSGGVALERGAAEAPWRISTHDGAVRLDAGAIEVACLDLRGSPATRALLRSGSGAAEVDPRTDLVPGREVWLRGGALVLEGPLDSVAQDGSQRTGAAATASAEPNPAAPVPATKASLRGTVAVQAGAQLPETFVVTLLRRERLPEVSRPKAQEFREPAFAIEGLRPGRYTVFVQARGFATWQRNDVELEAGAPPVALSVVLDGGAAVRGRVVDRDGHPVEGATVLSETDTASQLLPFDLSGPVAPPTGWSAAVTDHGDGTFELAHLSRGTHRLRATRPGSAAVWSEPIDLSAGDATDVTLRLVEGGAIEGQVAHDDGTPWQDALVIASWMDMSTSFSESARLSFGHATADAQGHYAIEDLPPGLYVVLNAAEAQGQGASRVPRVQQAHVESGVRTRVDLPGGSLGTAVEGTLVGSDEQPLAGLDVTWVPSNDSANDWKSTRSREAGRFDLPSLAPGPYFVYVGADYGTEFSWQGPVEVPAVPVFRPTVHVGSNVVRGIVRNAATGAGLARSVVVFEVATPDGSTFGGRTVADADGRYVLGRLPAARYRVTAYAVTGRFGQETADDVTVDASAPEAVRDFDLRAGAGLVVHVRDGDGGSIAGARLRFLDASNSAYSFSPDDRSDAKGSLRILGVKPGRWKIEASAARHESSSTTLDLVADEERDVEITLRSSH